MTAVEEGRPAPPPEGRGERLSAPELEDLRKARTLLEGGGLVVRVAEVLGRPLEAGLERLPARAREIHIDHFQKRARGHFVVRRLETAHGYEVVREAYAALGS